MIYKIFNNKIKWQYPNNTEETFYKQLNDNILDNINYIAYPWATIVDEIGKKTTIVNYLKKKNILYKFNQNKLNVTCFQSYKYYQFINDFEKMNINVIFCPHIEKFKLIKIFRETKILILPVFLKAVINPNYNYLETFNKINTDNKINLKDFDLDYFLKNKEFENNIKYKISYIGANKYPGNNSNSLKASKIRNLCIDEIKNDKNNYIKVYDNWHYQNIVYGKQLNKIKFEEEKENLRYINEINYYQNILYSKYILCPRGIGPNSFRISETISFGKIPIIIADNLLLPKINNLNISDYSIKVNEDNINFNQIISKLDDKNLQKINNNLTYVKKYIDNLIQPLIDFLDERFNLLTIFYDVKNEERLNEYNYCFDKNINNDDIKAIYVFFENTTELKLNDIKKKFEFLNNPKIKLINLIKKESKNVSFNEIIEYANKNLYGEKIIISNNDIYFENLNKIKKYNLIKKNMINCITRTNCFDMISGKGTIWKKHTMSQDTWIYLSPIKEFKNDIYIGWIRCDNRIAYEFKKLGYNLSNPTEDILCYHYQKTFHQKNDLINEFVCRGNVLNVPFTKLNEKCLTFNIKYKSVNLKI